MHRVNTVNYSSIEDAAARINSLPEIRIVPQPMTSACCLVCRTEIRTPLELPKACPVCWSSLGVE